MRDEKIKVEIFFRFLTKYLTLHIGFFIKYRPELLPQILEEGAQKIKEGFSMRSYLIAFFYYYLHTMSHIVSKKGGKFEGPETDTMLANKYYKLYEKFEADTSRKILIYDSVESHVSRLKQLCHPEAL